MKKKLLGFITCLSILISTSCTQTSPGGSNIGGGSSQLSWSCKIDGVPYSWSGTYPPIATNDGSSQYITGTGTDPYATIGLFSPSISGKRKVMFSFIINQLSTGTYNFNPNNFSTYRTASVVIDTSTSNFGVPEGYYSNINGSFTVNINTLSPNSYSNSGLAGAGLVTGTFSGTLTSFISNRTITITNGQFNAIRLN